MVAIVRNDNVSVCMFYKIILIQSYLISAENISCDKREANL